MSREDNVCVRVLVVLAIVWSVGGSSAFGIHLDGKRYAAGEVLVARRDQSGRSAQVSMVKTDRDVLSVCEEFEKDPAVAWAQPNYEYHVCRQPNDPDFPDQYAHQLIEMTQAWDISTGSRDVVIAIVGTGVEIDHLPREAQERLYAEFASATGMTWGIQDFSGGKSVHSFLLYDRLLEPRDPIRLEIQQLLIVALCGDSKIVDARRLMRLPGWPGHGRPQPLLSCDPTARYSPEAIRDALAAHVVALGIEDVAAALTDIRLAERLCLSARDLDAEGALQALDHAALLREARGRVSAEDRSVARALLGVRAAVGGTGFTASAETDAVEVVVAKTALVPFRGMPPGARVTCPCCPPGKSAAALVRGDGTLWCFRCGGGGAIIRGESTIPPEGGLWLLGLSEDAPVPWVGSGPVRN